MSNTEAPGIDLFDCRMSIAEEASINPSLLVCLAGCDLNCAFCNASWRHPCDDYPGLTPESFTALQREAADAGARTIQLTGGEPTLHVDALSALLALPRLLPVIVNSHLMWDAREVREAVSSADVVIGSLKFGNDECAQRLSGATDYLRTVRANLDELASAGCTLLVRHLVMPGHLECCWRPAAQWLSSHLPEVPVSLLFGYVPPSRAPGAPELLRCLEAGDISLARRVAEEHGLLLEPNGSWKEVRASAFADATNPQGMKSETVELIIDRNGRICFHGYGATQQALRSPS